MKKLMMTFLGALCFVGISNAQDNDNETSAVLDTKHELRLDALDALGFTSVELNYEYVLSKYSGVGAALTLNFGDTDDSFNGQKFALTPFYRQYFLNKKEYGATGLFVEGMMQLAAGEQVFYEFFPDTGTSTEKDENWFNVGAGLAVGQKWVSNNGFVFELSAGGARYFVNGDNQPDAFFRGGVLVGYRF